jgi:hypothetical protein
MLDAAGDPAEDIFESSSVISLPNEASSQSRSGVRRCVECWGQLCPVGVWAVVSVGACDTVSAIPQKNDAGP